MKKKNVDLEEITHILCFVSDIHKAMKYASPSELEINQTCTIKMTKTKAQNAKI